MKDKGKLVRWNNKKGFGFLEDSSFDDDVFIHISALKNMARQPRDGDVIYFDRVVDEEGKTWAEYASIKGVAIKSPDDYVGERSEQVVKNRESSNKPGFFLILMGLLSIFYLYQTFSPNPLPIPMPKIFKELIKKDEVINQEYLSKPKNYSSFSCQGKHYCSQMTSCNEAKFYLKNCPNVKIDGNRDGVPCEKQWCQ